MIDGDRTVKGSRVTRRRNARADSINFTRRIGVDIDINGRSKDFGVFEIRFCVVV